MMRRLAMAVLLNLGLTFQLVADNRVGDANHDGTVDAADAALVQSRIYGITLAAQVSPLAMADGDASLNLKDMMLVAQAATSSRVIDNPLFSLALISPPPADASNGGHPFLEVFAVSPPLPGVAGLVDGIEIGFSTLPVSQSSLSAPSPTVSSGAASVTVTPLAAAPGEFFEVVLSVPVADSSGGNLRELTAYGMVNVWNTSCGDSNTDSGETCDDGNTLSGDGCACDCRLEVPLSQWASEAVAYSSQFSATDWSAAQATGPPDVPACGDIEQAWSSSCASCGLEWIELEYPVPAHITQVGVVESYEPGALVQIEAYPYPDGAPVVLWSGSDPWATCPGTSTANVSAACGSVLTNRIRVTLDQTLTTSYSEIDAVQITGYTLCGNGQPDAGEHCDDGPGGACLDDCSGMNVCGDGIAFNGEACDDGASNGTCGLCDATCTGLRLPVCGDSVIECDEGCDDGNLASGDGCADFCQVEVNPALLPGLTCGVDDLLLDGDIIIPSGLDSLLAGVVPPGTVPPLAFTVTGQTPGLLEMIGAVLTQDNLQDFSLDSIAIPPADFSDNPRFAFQIPDLTMAVAGLSLHILDLAVSMEFNSGLTGIQHGTAQGRLDPAPINAVLGEDLCILTGWCDLDGYVPIQIASLSGPCYPGLVIIKNPPIVCGDGLAEAPEVCDDGPGGICHDDCSAFNVCGDGVAFAGEPCDDGANGDPCDGCLDDCQLTSSLCGNAAVECAEVCDDGPGGTCREDCSGANTCGDGFHLEAEECDDGNNILGDGCTCDCRTEMLVAQWATDAPFFSSQYGATNWSAQQATGAPNVPYCGDHGNAWASSCANCGIEWIELTYDTPIYINQVRVVETFWPGAVVQVDAYPYPSGPPYTIWSGSDPNQSCPGTAFLDAMPTCGATRSNRIRVTIDQTLTGIWSEIDAVQILGSTMCGNGLVELDEVCDDGPGGTCLDDCIAENICGDSIVFGSEACDDGPGGSCFDDCSAFNVCGDVIVFDGEACDDGPGGTCFDDCTGSNICGDSIVFGGETCDDGPGGSCLDDCSALNVCGDSTIFEAEECDDGNTIPGDGCSCDCRNEIPVSQWAFNAPAHSSQFSSTDWAAGQAIGPPNVAVCGDDAQAWASSCPTCGVEWIELSYSMPVYPTQIEVVESFFPGALVQVEAYPYPSGSPVVIWSGTDPNAACPGTAALNIPGTCGDIRTSRIRVTVDQALTGSYSEIDAVQLHGYTLCGNGLLDMDEACDDGPGGSCRDDCTGPQLCGDSNLDVGEECDDGNQVAGDGCTCDCQNEASFSQWAVSAPTFSAEYSPTNWSAAQATGAPDVAVCADDPLAWTTPCATCGEEWIELAYATPVYVTQVDVHESYSPGALVRLDIGLPFGIYSPIWTGADPLPAGATCPNGIATLNPALSCQSPSSDRIMLTIDQSLTPSYTEIDAVQLTGYTLCGNGRHDYPELCDDGNATPGDGCNPACTGP